MLQGLCRLALENLFVADILTHPMRRASKSKVSSIDGARIDSGIPGFHDGTLWVWSASAWYAHAWYGRGWATTVSCAAVIRMLVRLLHMEDWGT